MAVQEAHRLEISALKQALRGLKNVVLQRDAVSEHHYNDDETKGALKFHIPRAGSELGRKKRRTGKKTKGSGAYFSPIGQMLLEMSSKVGDLAELAEDAAARAAESADRCRQLEGQVEDLEEEKSNLQQLVTDFHKMVETSSTTGGLEAEKKGRSRGTEKEKLSKKGGHIPQPSHQLLAGRLIALSEELRTVKLTSLKQRRQIQALREEKQHLQKLVASVEANVAELEEEHTKASLDNIIADLGSMGDREGGSKSSSAIEFSEEQRNFVRRMDGTAVGPSGSDRKAPGSSSVSPSPTPSSSPLQMKRTLSIETDLDEDGEVISKPKRSARPSSFAEEVPESLIKRLQQQSDELLQCGKEIALLKSQNSTMQGQLSEQAAYIHEKEGQLHYYERVLREEGIPAAILSGAAPNRGENNRGDATDRTGRPYRMMREDQEKLQEAASATIGSLRALLEEKNRLIEKYKQRVEELQIAVSAPNTTSTGKAAVGKSRASRKADELLARLSADDDIRRRMNSGEGHGQGQWDEADRRRLLDQLDQADKLLVEREQSLQQLEQKLLAQSNQRERAEARCGEALQELEAMKADMLTLVQQLNDSEARRINAEARNASVNTTLAASLRPSAAGTIPAPPQPQPAHPNELQQLNRIRDLEKANKAKADKIRGYREIIVRLKDQVPIITV